MKYILICFFGLILSTMIGITIWASSEQGIFAAGSQLIQERWFIATLADAYFGFLTFGLWVYYKETSSYSKFAWILAILLLGNIAMAIYSLIAISKTADFNIANLLLNELDQISAENELQG